jgi:PKD repeat protein
VGITVTVPSCTKGGGSDASTVVFTSQNEGTESESTSLTTTANYVAPVATADEYFLSEDTSRIVAAPGVLGNDYDANCDSLSASLEATPANGTVVLEVDGSFAYTPTANFDGVDTFIYSASDGDLIDTATVTLTVISAGDDPIVDAGEDQTADEGETVEFSGGFVDPARQILFNGESILWDFGDGTTATDTLTPTHQYRDNGLFTVTLTVTDTVGDAGQDSLLVTVSNVAPTADAGPDRLGVPGVPLSITGDVADPGLDDTHSIVWDLDDGTIVHDTLAFEHTYVAFGVYTVTLTVVDDDDGEDSDTAVISVWHRAYLPLVAKAYAP